MNRFLPLLLLVLAAGAGAWLLFSPANHREVPAAAEVEAETKARLPDAAGAAEPVPARAVEAALQPEAPVEARVPIGGEAPGAGMPDGFEPSSEEEDALLVRVVEPDGETPVPGAVVFHIDTQEVDEEEAFQTLRELEDVIAAMERLGRRFRADSRGEVRVPYAGSGLVLGGRTEDYFHFEMIEDPEPGGEILLTLQPRSQLQAQVFGPSGRPVAGVPVALVIKFGGFAQPMMSATTKGKDGIATMRDFAPLLEMGPMAAAGVEIALALPLAEPVAERVDLDELPEEPFLLELPPTGKVLVEVYDVDGKRLDIDAEVTLMEAVDEDRVSFQLRAGPGLLPGAGRGMAPIEGGVARFPFVGLGMLLRASVELPDYAQAITAEGPGPAAAGQTVRLRLQPRSAACVLVGRVIDERGAPIASTKFNLVYQVDSQRMRTADWSDLKTDERGRFRFPLVQPEMPEAGTRTLEFSLPGKSRGESLARVRLDLQPAYPPGQTDLGDIVLAALPFLAAGTVVGPSGEPVAGAKVMLQWKSYYGNGEDHWFWRNERRIRTTTDAEGRFELRGRPENEEAEEFQLQATTDGFLPAVAGFLPGAGGILLQLGAGCSLSGRVLVDDGLDLDDFELVFVHETEDQGSSRPQVGLEENGEFHWNALEPGKGRVEIVPNPDEPPLFVADGIVLVPGENRDARLDPVDLRGRLKAITLEFVDEAGDPLPQVMLTGLGKDSKFWEHTWRGRQVVYTGKGSLDLLLTSEGYQSVELRGLDRDTKVVFRRSAELLFVLAEPVSLPEGELLTVALRREGARGWWRGSNPGEFNALGEARLSAPGSGEYRVVIGTVRHRGNSSISTSMDDCSTPASITIQDAAVSQTYTIRVDLQVSGSDG